MRTSGTSGPIRGIGTNSNAAAGNIGEYMTDALAFASQTSLSSGAAKTIISLTGAKTLTPGDWDVDGVLIFDPAVTTSATAVLACISLTTNVLAGADDGASAQWSSAANVLVQNLQLPTPTRRVTVAAGTTQDVHLVAIAIFTASTAAGAGGIRARRAPNTG